MNKFERQGTILRLVGERQLSTQGDVVEALRDEGLDAVQATVSRDIAQLGLVKVRGEGGRLVYALPGGVLRTTRFPVGSIELAQRRSAAASSLRRSRSAAPGSA